jgi:hypothetical protein
MMMPDQQFQAEGYRPMNRHLLMSTRFTTPRVDCTPPSNLMLSRIVVDVG